MTLVFKSGDCGDPANCRPVTLVSHVIKIFERVIAREMIRYLENTEKLAKNQHCFRAGMSCVSQLLQHKQWVLKGLTEGADFDVVYFNFAKAFDKFDHRMLLGKTHEVDIRGKLNNGSPIFSRTGRRLW